MLYRIGLPSNTASPFALFEGRLRTELHSSSIRTNTAIELKCSCIRSMACFPPKRAILDCRIIPDYRESEDSVLHACWMVYAPLRLESDGRTESHG